ncbi:D-amino acid dehydrogenase [Xylophilus sp. ASV27]|uniref:D-amino acid dehydrogenase n=1 Tax=Xylophilus sp. ASV27 TaxID=2795129 RepID=UPI0018ECA6DA|nr:D-amino acid dehydrogenase [Xylophilus sp. ASV27]
MPSLSKHVCILGAGIAGLATAYTLQRQGHQVTLLDRAAPGQGASGGNGAQLSYSYVQPLADPGLWRQLPHLLLAADSPLKLRPRLDPRQWRWALEFLAACNARTSRDTTAQLLALAAESRAGFEAMRADLRPDCDFSARGKLVLYASAAALAAAERQLALQQALGSAPQRIVKPDECARIEPALDACRARIAGAVYTPSECAADCLKVCEALARALEQRGARLLCNTEALGLEVRGGRVVAVRTAQGALAADCFVLALGSGSARLARPLGVRVPVYPLKGYSLTLELGAQAAAGPQVSVTDSARKVVFARIGSRLRVAGMAEIVGHENDIPPARMATLRQATQAVFPQLAGAAELQHWTGMRPATPTGRPLLGRLPGAPEGLLFNTGHGALGFTLAFGSAERLVRMI